MEKPLETAWEGPEVEWGGISGNYWGTGNKVSQVDGDSDMASACLICALGEGSEKEEWLLLALLSRQKLHLQLSP